MLTQEFSSEKKALDTSFQNIRNMTMDLCRPLENEDYVIQCAEDVSPIKWHLAHVTWFFETFILSKFISHYPFFNKEFQTIFNSYYQGLNEPFPKQKRGFLSRPLVKDILQYHSYVNDAIKDLIQTIEDKHWTEFKFLITLGMQHEQQHQELILMDIKYNFSVNPTFPSYLSSLQPLSPLSLNKEKTLKRDLISPKTKHPALMQPSYPTVDDFAFVDGGITEIGNHADTFTFDNELPRHQQILKPFLIANKLVTNGEYLQFMQEGGYQEPKFWLAEGFETSLRNHWQAPLYWQKSEEDWYQFTLLGLKPLDLQEPVAHLSYFEADAFANWANCRLPTEIEWEHFVEQNHIRPLDGNFLENALYHPRPAEKIKTTQQVFGDLWEWTSSSYGPYPGFKPLSGTLGEYNGKFMSGQMVLRGGSFATPRSHIRSTYRNFYHPDKRWQFAGVRLAKDA